MSTPPTDPAPPAPEPPLPEPPLPEPPSPELPTPERDFGSDEAILSEAEPGLPPWEGQAPAIPVLHLDAHLVAVSKPPGLLVHRIEDSPEKVVLLQAVRDQIGAWLYPVHRLDRPASGVIVFGLSRPAAAALQKALPREETRKEYLVLARGECPDAFESRRPLRSQRGQPQEAWTEFQTLARGRGCSLLRARLHTGRYHQIRRHLAHLAHQVLGDTSYGKGRLNALYREQYGLSRLFLHAARLLIAHPAGEGTLDLRAPLADDLRQVLLKVGGFDPDMVATL